MGMGNLNWHRATGAARAEVRDQGGCLSRAAPQGFTADGPLARALPRQLTRYLNN
jgi:hypothetical protein